MKATKEMIRHALIEECYKLSPQAELDLENGIKSLTESWAREYSRKQDELRNWWKETTHHLVTIKELYEELQKFDEESEEQ